jgi:hypothetical protein
VSLTSGFPIFIYKFGSLFNQKGWYVRAPDDALSYDWLAEEFTQPKFDIRFRNFPTNQ